MKRRASLTFGSGTRAAGLTLVELMLVVTLLSFLVGIGLGVFAGLDPARHVARSLLQNVLRSAHNSAIAREASARVRLDAEKGTLTAEEIAVIGTWHFEKEPVEGAFELDGAALGLSAGYISPDGYQGKALALAGQPAGARVEVPVQTDPAYDFEAGFTVEFALRLEADRAGKLLDIGRVLVVGVRRGGVLEAAFLPEAEGELGTVRPGGKIVLRTPPASLASGRWSRVAIRYDRRRFTLTVDGVELASVLEAAPVWKVEHPMSIGGGETPFPGSLDSLVVSAVRVSEAVVLPQGVRLAEGTPAQVLFAPGGGLDVGEHNSPVDLVLEFDDGLRERTRVNLYGTVE